MREHRSKFLAAKVNINGNIFSSDKEELIHLIPDAILMKPEKVKNSWTWKFTNLKEFSIDDTRYVFGHLIRSRIETVNIVNEDKIETFEIPKPVAYSSKFLYDAVSEVLIFEEPATIRREEFIDIFQRLVFSANIKIGEIKVKLIPRKEQIRKKIMAIDVITKVEFNLIPPNFHKKDTFSSLNEIIQDENATRMKTVFENKSGLNKEGKFLNEGIEMVSSAYGEVKVYGYDNVPSRSKHRKTRKKQTNYNSKDSVNMKKIKIDSDDSLIDSLKSFAIEMRNFLM